jgi:hypothetical protein
MPTDADIKWLTDFKAEIDQAKIDKAGIDGAINQNMARLKSEFGCGSVAQGNSKLQALKTKKEQLDVQIEDSVAVLKEKYGQ